MFKEPFVQEACRWSSTDRLGVQSACLRPVTSSSARWRSDLPQCVEQSLANCQVSCAGERLSARGNWAW